jgi:aryl-alcohol dehydrogenase-like predicted oxidoreductase
MLSRPLGNTGITVSEYGLGTWAMGGGIYGVVEDQESIRAIHRAEEFGINFLDTAPLYSISERRDGRAERVIGKALAGRRDKWIIATKFGRHLNGNQNWKEMDLDFSGARAAKSVEESLERLGTDYLDVLFVHSPPRDLFDPEETFAAMEKLKEQGKIRVVGYSFWESVEDTLDLVEPYLKSGLIGAVQVILSLLRPQAENLLFPLLREAGTGVVAREALANGFLTESFTPETVFDAQHNKSRMDRELIENRLSQASKFRFLVDEREDLHSLAEAALVWTLSHPEVSCVIPGVKTVEELEQCLSAADAPLYSSTHLARVREVAQGYSWIPNPAPR